MPVYKRTLDGKWFARINYKDAFGRYKTITRGYYDTKREAAEAETNARSEMLNSSVSSPSNLIGLLKKN